MRRAFVVWVLLASACAFQPEGAGVSAAVDAADLADAADDTDGAAATEPDAAGEPSTVPDASLPLPDASLPLPDASLPLPDAAMPPVDAAPPATELACTNGDDDDDDGKTDCRDDDCPSCGGLLSCCGSGACALICL
jgi:hypothetical protein